MATVTLAYNHSRDPMSPAQLADQIATSLGLASYPAVDITPTQIIVTHPSVTSGNTAAIQALVNAYVFDSAWSGGPSGQLLARAQQALAVNAAFLAIGSPTNAQVLTQVQRLTRECSGLIRLALGQYDSLADS